MSETSFDDQAYEKEMNTISEMFPTAKFSICVSLDELNEVLSTEEHIVITCDHSCYCHDHNPRNNEYFVVRKAGNHITCKDAISAMILGGYDPKDCNHHFLEGFCKGNGIQFDACFGS
jgi:hypothetical protein